MNINKKKTVLIIALCISLVLMGTGYSFLSSKLNVSGTNNMAGVWDIQIKSITPTATNGLGVSNSINIDTDRLGASLSTSLYEHGDYVEYTVIVRNNGNIPAKLSTVNFVDPYGSQYLEITHNFEEGSKLLANSENTYTIRFEFLNPNDDEISEELSYSYSFVLNFIQDTGV